ncbi:sulfotransferase 1B1 [Patella vulgata]|uniref:sulfotransferase 1B1 n=1 Tax=Patella vulgata TaxID=6465 RepID=UPI0024A962AB|nr:sulfotransferase 1B1 [Patella vulgata]
MLICRSPEHSKDDKECQMLEFTETGIMDKLPSPRLLNTHLSIKHLPKQIFTKKTKIVYVYRNPKDVAVSLYCHITGIKRTNGYEGRFEDFLDLFLREKVAYGKWGDYIKEWEDIVDKGETPIIAIAYEDMKRNPVKYIKEVAQFLELDVTDELCAAIADACSFSKMKSIAENFKENALNITWKEGSGMLRKGQVGDWKNWITVADNERFDEFIETKMKESHMKFIYTL